MKITVKRALALTSALMALAGTAAVSTASAGPSPTPSGLTGACNMLHAWGVGTNGGMANAMSV
ncbi:MAG TPA: hypothetical protein VFL58_14355, partial [Gaiellaceae bacterium]|nr:hypothetical protein [Gaiellaceae bacterium]